MEESIEILSEAEIFQKSLKYMKVGSCNHICHFGSHVWCHPFGNCCDEVNKKYDEDE